MNTQPNDGGPAYPWQYMDRDSMGVEVTREQGMGMSLRDYFATAALQGIISNQQLLANLDDMVPEKGTRQVAAYFAYACADAMLSARERKKDE